MTSHLQASLRPHAQGLRVGRPSDQDDTLQGGDASELLVGLRGNDSIDGGLGDDTLLGGAGNDTLRANPGHGQFDDDTGSSLLDGGAGNDLLDFSPWNYAHQATLIGGSGNDSLYSGAGHDLVLDGGSGNDWLSLGTSYNGPVVVPLSGAKPLIEPAITHHALLSGGSGNDTLSASWVEAATLSGGAGVDTFVLTDAQYRTQADAASGSPVQPLEITDFKAGKGGDVLDLTELVTRSATGLDGANPFGTGFLQLVQSGADTLLQFDADGSAGTARSFLTLAVLRGVEAARLTRVNFQPGFAPSGASVPGKHLHGGDGAETLRGGAGNDHVQAGGGNDHVDGGVGHDALNGGAGDDTLMGGFGNDTLRGDAGNDTLSDDLGNNLLDGGDGADLLSAHSNSATGMQTLLGGAGNDMLQGNAKGLLLDGGIDDDVLTASAWTPGTDPYGPVLMAPIPGASATLIGGAGNDTLSALEVERVQLRGDAGNDDLGAGMAREATLLGGAGQDTLHCDLSVSGGPARYSLDGGADDDVVTLSSLGLDASAASAEATLAGGSGNDKLALISLSGTDLSLKALLNGGDGDDSLSADAGRELTLTGGSGNDVLILGSALDSGGAHVQEALLDGGSGNDTLTAAQVQAATLVGGSGDDLLIAVDGVDQLGGGSGRDVFRFTDWSSLGLDATRDRITDFARGQDHIDLSGLDADPGTAGDQAFSFVASGFGSAPGQLSYAKGVIALNTDTDAAAEYQIQLVGQVPKQLSAADFIL